LQGKDPWEILASLNSRKIGFWFAYYDMVKFGEDNTHFLLGLLCELVYNANKGKNAPNYTIWDFLRREPPLATDLEIHAMLRGK